MALRFSTFVGLRYASAGRSSALVSFLSRLSMAGLAISVGLLILVLSVMNGFDREMRQRILGLVPQVTVHRFDGSEEWQTLAAEAERHPEVRAVAPFIRLDGLLMKGRAVAGVLAYGIDPDREREVSIVERHLSGTDLAGLGQRPWSTALGSALADELGVEPGDRVTLVLPATDGAQPVLRRLTVAGTLDSGTELDQNLLLLRFEDALTLAPGADGVDLRLALDDLFAAPRVARELEQQLPWGLYISDWTRSHGNLYSAIQLSRRMVSLMLAIIIAVAAFNVVSTLVMVVNDKQGDIAILRSQGARPGSILAIFMLQGSLIGAVGTAAGVALGALLTLLLPLAVPLIEALLGFRFLSTDVYPIDYLPVDLRLADVLLVASTALLMSLLATVYPAWRAARARPAEALRHE